MNKLNKKCCSVFCFCIDDTVKLEECEKCTDFSAEKGRCTYEKS
jgi:hypothetical protein